MVSPPRSRELASFLAGLRLSDLPSDALRLLKLCVLDHFGCALGALDTEVGRAALRAAQPLTDKPASAAIAAFVYMPALIYAR